MTTSKIFLRDLLGMILIISTVFAVLNVMMDVLAFLAYLCNEVIVATTLLHESFYLIGFFIPPYFIGKYINRSDLVSAVQNFRLMKSRNEQF